jgi:hypothetical protein
MKRLEAARKEMAPKIGTCVASNDKSSSFVCRIDYGSADASVKAQATANGKGTKVFIEIKTLNVFATPIGIIGVIAILLIGFIIEVFLHPKTIWDWFYIPGCTLIYPCLYILLMPLSKHVLSRFIHDTLLDDSESRVQL